MRSEKIMEVGDVFIYKNNIHATLIEKNKNYGLFLFSDGGKIVFNINRILDKDIIKSSRNVESQTES